MAKLITAKHLHRILNSMRAWINSRIEKLITAEHLHGILKHMRAWMPVIIAALIIFFCTYYTIFTSKRVVYFEHHGKKDLFVALLVIVNNLLVTYNTVLFINETINTSKETDVDVMNPKQRKRDNFNTGMFTVFNLFTLAISVLTVFIYVLKLFEKTTFSWGELFQASEGAAIFMFGFFIVADTCILIQFINSKEINQTKFTNASTDELKDIINKRITKIVCDIRFTRNALWLIDIAGFVGIVVINLLAHRLEYKSEHNNEQLMFREGFAVGAIAFHIFFTQINFALLNALKTYQ